MNSRSLISMITSIHHGLPSYPSYSSPFSPSTSSSSSSSFSFSSSSSSGCNRIENIFGKLMPGIERIRAPVADFQRSLIDSDIPIVDFSNMALPSSGQLQQSSFFRFEFHGTCWASIADLVVRVGAGGSRRSASTAAALMR